MRMKILITEQQFSILREAELKELRSKNYQGRPALDVLKDYIEQHGIDNVCISFRDSIHTSDINKRNQFNTPTGYYFYPLKSFKDELNLNSWTSFIRHFPFGYDRPYVTLFTIKDKDGILYTSSSDEEKCHMYAKKLYDMYKNNPKVTKLYEKYLKKDPSITEPHNRDYRVNVNNVVNLLWIFIFELANLLSINKKQYFTFPLTFFNILCRKIGINGFVDDICGGFIHSSETCQGVLFKFKSITDNVVIIDSYAERQDRPISFEKTTYDFQTKRSNFLKFLYEKFGKKVRIYYDTKQLQSKLKNDFPILVSFDDKPFTCFFINNKGDLSIKNLNIDNLNNKEKAAYINTKTKNFKYDYVSKIDEYFRLPETSELYIGSKTSDGLSIPTIIDINGNVVKMQPTLNMNHTLLIACMNSLTNSQKYIDHPRLTQIIQTNPFYIAVASIEDDVGRSSNYKNVILNLKGEEDVSGLDPRKLMSHHTEYFNILLHDDVFKLVYSFDKHINKFVAKPNISFDTPVFINIHGQYDVSGLDRESLDDFYQNVYDNTVDFIQNKNHGQQ